MADYDVVVIGGGPGGYVAAIRAAQLGLRAAVIDDNPVLGGTCLRIGCIPSKALLESSELYWQAGHRFGDHGIGVGGLELDLERMMGRKDAIVEQLTGGIGTLMKKNKVEVVGGRGRLLGTGKVEVTGTDGRRELTTGHVILAMGSVPVELPDLPFDGRRIISSTEALELDKVPKRLLVVGAGAIGLEMGSVWARLGAEVTVVELLPQIVPFADRQLAQALQRELEAQGLAFKLSSKVTGAKVTSRTVTVTIESEDSSETLKADRVLVAVGRRPNTRGQGLEEAGVELDERGFVRVDGYRTSVDSVWAIGDLAPGPMLAHKASEEGVAVAERIAGQPGAFDPATVPNVVYTSPELATVGRTEDELKQAEIPYRSGRFLFRANGRAKALGEEAGMVKVLAHRDTDRILGVHMLGPRVSELIAEAVVAMEFAASSEDLARIIHAHPTLSEVVHEAALAVDRRAIHS
jgi:dihydrolipoyl dehydrogenase